MSPRTLLLAGVVGLVGVGGFFLLQTTQVTHEGVKVGKVPAAEATCKDPDCLPPLAVKDVTSGARIDDAALAGKVVVLNFWAPWCHPCLEEMPDLERVWRRNKERGLVMLGMGLDLPDDAAARDFAARQGLSYPIARIDRAVERAFGRPSMLPTTLIYDRNGHQVKRIQRAVTAADLEALVAPLLR